MKTTSISSNYYWQNKLRNKENLITSRSLNTKSIKINILTSELSDLKSITNQNVNSSYVVFISLYSYLLSRYFTSFTGDLISHYIFDGSNTKDLLFDMNLFDENITLKEYILLAKKEVEDVFNNLNYNQEYVEGLINNKVEDLSKFFFSFNSSPGNNKYKKAFFHLQISEHNSNDIIIQINYLEGILEDSMVLYFVKSLKNCILHINEYLNIRLSDIPLLSEKDKENILRNSHKNSFSISNSIIELIDMQIKKTPNHTSIVFENNVMSYRELGLKINSLSNSFITEYGIKKGDRIAVLLPKSDISVITFFAILKIGAIYIPIDKKYPIARINFILNDCQASVIVTDEKNDLINSKQIIFNKIDTCGCVKETTSIASPYDLAYIIYTSGTTGSPKGVMIKHTGVVNMCISQKDEFEISEKDNIIWFASPSFDASISEILMALTSGASLYIPTDSIIRNMQLLLSYIDDNNCTVMTLPPTYLNLIFPESFKKMRCIITAGEAANPSKANEIIKHGISYFNAYGSTEYSVCATIYKLQNIIYQNEMPIGHPIANTYIYILDKNNNLQPTGVKGKIFISGIGLAEGYYNRPELNKEKFIQNPFLPNSIMYDTGDWGFWKEDGNIQFVGRMDTQVKVRGYRIDCGEIEASLMSFTDLIKECVVISKSVNNNLCLVAYVVSCSTGLNIKEIRNRLKEKLPDYMIPSFFVPIDSIPVTINGKRNIELLPEISGNEINRMNYVPAKSIIEEKIVKIWEKIFNTSTIGITDNFFDLGGNSLMITQVINEIYKTMNLKISYDSFFNNPTILGLTSDLNEEIYENIPIATPQKSYVVTPQQNAIWIVSQMIDASKAYNMLLTIKVESSLDFDLLQRAFDILVGKHESLRTYFDMDNNGKVKQFIQPLIETKSQIEIVEILSNNNKMGINKFLLDFSNTLFDLSAYPLFRICLIQNNGNNLILAFLIHHIICDGISMNNIVNELFFYYSKLKNNITYKASPMTVQYKDYSEWIVNQYRNDNYIKSEQYWLRMFETLPTVIKLPSCRKRPDVKTYNGKQIKKIFSHFFCKEWDNISKEFEISSFMTLVGIVKILLYKYSGVKDITIGTPVSGRIHPELEEQIGLYVNMIAIRTKIEEHLTIKDFFTSIKKNMIHSYECKNYPFEHLISKISSKRDISRSPLFDIIITYQSAEEYKKLNAIHDIEISNYFYSRTYAQFDLSFNFIQTENFELIIEYNTDIYDNKFVNDIFVHIEELMKFIDTNKNNNNNISSINILSPIEINKIMNISAGKVAVFRETILDELEYIFHKYGEKKAILFKEKAITFEQIRIYSNQFSHFLISKYNIKTGDVLGLRLRRNEMLIPIIIGVLKTGACYLPIDTEYPDDRINYILDNSKCKVVIDEHICKEFIEQLPNLPYEKLDIDIKKSNSAYIIYTSGSTGNPKGVIVTHGGVSSLMEWAKDEYAHDNILTTYAFTSYCFDLSVFEFFFPLYTGKQVRILSELTEVKEYITEDRNVLINTVPSVVKLLLNDDFPFENVSSINVAGEVFPKDIANELLKRKLIVRNLYGPTEDTVYSSCYKIENEMDDAIPIGKPIYNTNIYILDDFLNLVPTGVKGNIYIAGAGLSKGYVDNYELTCKLFISNPYAKNEILYNTGDMGMWLTSDNLCFLGRNDTQVKINGHRIELSEIENTIYGFSNQFRNVIVLVDQQKILAYIEIDSAFNKVDLRTFLEKKLPLYMVPNYYIVLSSFPLNANGKVDKRSLLSIRDYEIIDCKYDPPVTPTEKVITKIWEEVLSISPVGINDNFFERGGQSLIAVRILHLINHRFSLSLTLKHFLQCQTISNLSALIDVTKETKDMQSEDSSPKIYI